jgi:hypothetical protein
VDVARTPLSGDGECRLLPELVTEDRRRRLEHGRRLPAPDVEDLDAGDRLLERPEHGPDDVVDINEIAKLGAIFVDGDRLAGEHSRRDDRQDTCVRILERLPRTIDVLEPEDRAGQAVRGGELEHKLFLDQLSVRIGDG